MLIYRHIISTGLPPTMLELASMLRCSPSTVHTIVHGLIDHGYLEQSGTIKTITFTEQGLKVVDDAYVRDTMNNQQRRHTR